MPKPVTISAAIVLAFAAPAHGETVRVHKIVQPVVVDTSVITSMYDDLSCFPFTCPFGILPIGLKPPGLIFVGFEHFQSGGFVYRGRVLFNTGDLPHQFKSAALVLNGVSFGNSGNLSNPLARTFETSQAEPSPQVFLPQAVLEEDLDVRRVTASSHPANSAFDDSILQSQVTASVQDTGSFHFRIDVTANANKWLQNWANRNQTPLHGFVLLGPDETLVVPDFNTTLFSYQVQLEFEIDEPVR